MRIEHIKLKNFRCYGPETTCVQFADLTTVIGSNGSGKTAILLALARLFGITAEERRIVPEDFHVAPGRKLAEINQRTLMIEVRVSFPELDREEPSLAVPECFQQMTIGSHGGRLFCRIRLEATWTKGLGQAGFVEEQMAWVCTDVDDPSPDDIRPMRAHERSRFQVLYVPAARDPGRQLRNVRGTLLARLLNAVQWSENPSNAIENAAASIEELFEREGGVALIHEHLTNNWGGLHDGSSYRKPRLRFAVNRVEDVIRNAEMAFGMSEVGDEHDIGRLSEGLRSLFYFALVGSIFDIEKAALGAVLAQGKAAGSVEGNPIPLALDPHAAPILTIFAIEEPENHLAPHYLGRIIGLLKRISALPGAQVVLASHSASIVGRAEPSDIRHVLSEKFRGCSVVNRIAMPGAEAEGFKFVREAVRAYPELYFARVVVLCEGDSEELIIPRLARSHGIDIDKSFVSVVPLGGRHVNHFWKLLRSLQIPYITLLDLDRERVGAGWGRISYVCKQLIAAGFERDEVLSVSDGRGGTRVLRDEELDEMSGWDVKDTVSMQGWMESLQEYDVFFSAPLDIDFLMLRAHTEAYKASLPEGTGPRIPDSGDSRYKTYMGDATSAVLGEAASGDTYSAAERTLFPWYRYLFLNSSKPCTHLAALAANDAVASYDHAPEVLKQLVSRIKEMLEPQGGGI